ncbi:MAG: hypothetical protein LUD25_03285 [Coriobacteriaceae bacterium]|nr:hypothetical protein [Coriobacteriaceae bacterium]
MQTLIDETVILRYLLEDEPRTFQQACSVIESGEAYTYPEIFARCAVTLRDVYRVPRSQIGAVLNEVLDDIYVVEDDTVRYANNLFGTSMLDYVDCLFVARNTLKKEHVMSFDKPLMKRTLPYP